MLLSVCALTQAQTLQITALGGFGPFTSSSGVSNSFTIQGYPTGAVADSVSWQIVNKDGPGGTLRVVRTAKTAGATWLTTMGDLPFLPSPQLNATASYVLNGQRTTRQLVATILMRAPTITWTATNNWAGIPIGSAFTGRFGVSGCPIGTSRIVVYLHPIFGANLDSVVRSGTPPLDSASILYKTLSHNGALSIQAVITFPGAPPGGYLIAKSIPDILPAVNVKPSLGFGPFVSGRDAFNVFTIDSTLGSYPTAVFTFMVSGRYGAVYNVGKQTAPWIKASDRFSVTANMGELPPYSTLRVDMMNSSGQIAVTKMVPINISRPLAPPLFTLRRQPPLVFESHGSDSIVLDTLPARTMRARLTLLSPTGQFIKDTSQQTGAIGFLTRASIKFDGGNLPLYTHTLRAEFWNNYNLNPTEYDYYFDVRDTTVPYVFATSWGPFVRTDSATFSMGVTDLRKPAIVVPTRRGWFQIVDTVNGSVLTRSSIVSLDTVKRTDSLWFSDSLENRVLIETATFPVSAAAQFIDVGINGAGDTVFTNIRQHPILMVQRPGVLTASAGYGPFIAGRNAPNTFRIDSLPDDTESVEFTVTGTVNPSDIDSLLLTQIVGNTAQFTTNMGMLPVNARLQVTVVTTSGPDQGVTLERFLYTVPDTLFMRPSLKFDTLTFAWQTSSAGARTQITGPRVIPDTFTIRRLPAQTETVTVATFDLQGNKIDTTNFSVPYRVRFDSTLVVKVPFTFSAFSTSRIEFRIFSTGGIPDGILTNRPIVVTKAPFALTARRFTAPANLDTISVHQGSLEQMDMTTRVILPGTNYGFAPNVVIDSTRIRFLTCNGTRVDSLLPQPGVTSPSTNIVSDTVFSITPLPLTTTRAEVTVYSKMLTLPKQGFTYSDTIRIVPGPVTYAPLRGDFPTFRVNDTVAHALYNPYTLRQLPLIDSISRFRVVNASNAVVASYPVTVPQRDSVNYVINMDSTVFPPSGSPYRILAQANYTVCTEQRTYAFAVDTFTVTRVLPDPAIKNYVWSSAGWGPFKQGKGKMSQFLASFQPSQFITTQDTLGADQLEVTLSTVTKGKDTVQAVFSVATNVVAKGASIPDVWRFPTIPWQIGGFNPGTWFKVKIVWTKLRLTGNVTQNTWNYYFPMNYLPFPPQPITSSDGWGPFDQSVTAGSAGLKTMQHPVTVVDSVGSDIIDHVAVWMLDHAGKRLDSLNMTAGAILGTGINQVSLYSLPSYDMAQFPWPNVARDNKNVTMKIGYYFQGNQALAASQNQTIELDPRAYWLNNSIVTATSVVGPVINLTVQTPLPTPSFTKSLPLIGSLPFTTADVNGNLYIQHRVTYNTGTEQFAFQASDAQPQSTFKWSPTMGGFFMHGSYSVTAADGETSDEFTAIRKFETDDEGNLNQNLRIRSKIEAGLSGSLTGLFHFLKAVLEVAKVIESGATDGIITFTPTFGVSLGSEQMMNLNLGVEESDQMTHVGTIPTLDDASTDDQDEYPTALSTGFNIDISVGGEIGLALDFFGIGISFDRQTTITWGSAYQGPLSNVNTTSFPFGGAERLYVDIDASLLWGLITLELYRGLMLSSHSQQGTPAFEIFKESFSSIFKSKVYDPKAGDVETPQVDPNLFTRQPLPAETPVYYSRPSVDADDSSAVVAWTEHTLRGRDGSVMLGRVDPATQEFNTTSVITTGRNAVHDPLVRLLRSDGTALVVWNENRNDAAVSGSPDVSPQLIIDMLKSEDLHAAIIDSKNVVVSQWTLGAESSSSLGRIDGRATATVSRDGNRALIAWPVQLPDNASSDVMAVVLTRNGSQWTSGPTTIIASTPGYDASVVSAPVSDNEFVVVWKHDADAARTGADVLWSRYNGTWTTPAAIRSDNSSTKVESISLDGNGNHAVLAIASSTLNDSTNDHELLISAFEYTNTWQEPKTMTLEGSLATMGDMSVSVGSTGRSHIVADVLYPKGGGGSTRKTYVYSAADASSNWVDVQNSKSVYDADHRIWSMSSAVGSNDVLYVATQEMDSTPGNVQQYANGIQVGANRINTVLRGVRLDNNRLVSVPFSGQAVSVQDDPIEQNLRYPCSLFQPYPNPTGGDAAVTFSVLRQTHVRVDVVDVTGTVMKTLVNDDLQDGVYDVSIPISTWPQGCYTIRMLTGTGQLMSKTFVVIR